MTFFILHYQSLRGLKKIAAFSFFYRMSQALFTIITIIILLQYSDDSIVPFYAYITSLTIVSLLAFVVFRSVLKEKIEENAEEEIEEKSLKNILAVAMPLMFAQSVQFIMAWTDKIMIGNMMSATDVGIYGVAFKLSMFASITLMAINSIAAPKFAEMYGENNIEGLKKVAQQSTKIIFWSTLPLVIIFFLFPTFFLGIFGGEFKIGVNAFIILSVGMLISAFSGSVGNLLQMTGKQFVFMKILIVGAIINIGLNYLLIPTNNPFSEFGISGINGAAVASMCSIIFWNLSMVFVVKKQFGFLTLYIPFIKR
jgi:O-antigen/teichoic acid export membrane protein